MTSRDSRQPNSETGASPEAVSPVSWLWRKHAGLLAGSLLIMLAAPYLGSLPVRTIPAVVALASAPDMPAADVPSAELGALLGSRANDLAYVLGLLVAAGLASFALALANTRVGARLSSVCARDLRAELHAVLLRRPPPFMRAAGRGNHMRNALIQQARAVASYAANTLPASVGIAFAVIIWAQTLFTAVSDSTSGPLAAAIVGGVVLLLIAINLSAVWIAGQKSQSSQRQVMAEQAAFIGLIGESVEHLETLQLELAQAAQRRRLDEILARMSRAEIRVASFGGLASAASSGVTLLGIPVLVLAWQAMELDGAQLAVMIPALMMLQRSIASIGSVWTSRKVSMPSVELVTELLAPEPVLNAEAPASPDGTGDRAYARPRGRGQLRFAGVRWSAPPGDGGGDQGREILAGVDLTVSPGETVALVGAGGCGKSTLLRVTLGILQPSSGQVLLDSRDIADMPLHEVRQRVAMLAQHPAFFARSVRENLLLDDRDIADGAVLEALRTAQFSEVLDGLDNGLDSRLVPGGGTLSGSEKRRLALARLLLRDPDVILIDELEAGLPQAQAQDILTAVRVATQGTTCLMVTHRPDLLKADRVAFVDNGCIVDIGTHEELMRRSEAYSSLLARRREDGT